MSKFTIAIVIILFSMSYTSCSSRQETGIQIGATPELAEGYPAPEAEGYPAPVENAVSGSGYPAPGGLGEVEIYATPGPVPTPGDETAVVTGRLLVEGKPVINVYIAFAEVITDEQGEERVVSYDQFNSPKALTDGEGIFAVPNVPPGRYGVILDTVISSTLLNKPEDNSAFIITAEAGENLDLGELDYDQSLPVPQDRIAP